MTVRVALFLPKDLETQQSGGIRTFVRDFVKYSPDDFEIEVVGVSTDARARPVGEWRSITFGQRSARFLPLIGPPLEEESRVPMLLRFTSALVYRRGALPISGRILQFHRPGLPLAFLRHRGPMVQWLHIDPIEGPRHTGWRRLPGLLRRVEALTLRRMDHVFMPGMAGVEFYRRRFPQLAERIHFSRNWFDAERFHVPDHAQRAAARAALPEAMGVQLAQGERVVLFVGRYEAIKDPRLLLDGFARLASAHPEARLVMVGGGALHAEIERWANDLGLSQRVSVLPARPPADIATLMRAADVLLLASHSEVSARVVLEALGSGLPVVATPAGEMRRVVRHAETGWIVEDRRAESLAEGLAWALAQPRDAIAVATSESVAEYVPEQALAGVFEAHRELARRYGV